VKTNRVNNSGRVIAFDWGLRNIGVAVGNQYLGTSEPLTTVRARDGVADWQAIAALLKEWQPECLIVGEPLNMDGTEADITARARKFSRQLHGRFGLPVELIDERLSSHEAKLNARERGHNGNYRANPIDAQAAHVILQSWLASRPLSEDS